MAQDADQPKRTVVQALQSVQSACYRCSKHFTHTSTGMECSLTNDTVPPAPPTPCPLPDLYSKVFRGTADPNTVTDDSVASVVPLYDYDKGEWVAPGSNVTTKPVTDTKQAPPEGTGFTAKSKNNAEAK